MLEQGGGKQNKTLAMKQSVKSARASSPTPKSPLFDKINPEVPDERPTRRDTLAMHASQRMNKA